jgi:hypothetical protein
MAGGAGLRDSVLSYCGECRQPCKVILVDFGLGKVEFWGAISYDTNKQLVSDCCEADAFNDESCTINVESLDG